MTRKARFALAAALLLAALALALGGYAAWHFLRGPVFSQPTVHSQVTAGVPGQQLEEDLLLARARHAQDGKEWYCLDLDLLLTSGQDAALHLVEITRTYPGLGELYLRGYFLDPELRQCALLCLDYALEPGVDAEVSPSALIGVPPGEGGLEEYSMCCSYIIYLDKGGLGVRSADSLRALEQWDGPLFSENNWGFSRSEGLILALDPQAEGGGQVRCD